MWMHGWLLIQRGSREVRAEPSGQGVCWDRATSWCEPSVHSATRFRGVLRPFGIRLPSRQGTKKVFYGGPSGSATRCNVQCERDGAVGSAGGNRGSAGLFCQMHLRTVGTAPITKAGEKNPKQRKRLGKSLKEPPARWRQRTIPLAGVPRSFPPRAGKCSRYRVASTETMPIPVHPGTRSKSGSLAKFTAICHASPLVSHLLTPW